MPAENFIKPTLEDLWATLQACPSDAASWCALGTAHLELGEPERSLPLLFKAVSLAPAVAVYQQALGLALEALGRLEEAAARYKTAIELDSEWAKPHENLSNLYRERLKGQGDAVEHMVCAIQLAPENLEGYLRLGLAVIAGRSLDEVRALARTIRERVTQPIRLYEGIGHAFALEGRYPDATHCFDEILRIYPSNGNALAGLGEVAMAHREFDAAGRYFDEAIRDETSVLAFRSHLAYLKALGELGRARAFFRSNRPRLRLTASFNAPEWKGESLAGKTILLHCDGGFGDTIQFVRFAAELKQRGATVVVRARKSLAGMLRGVAGVDHVVTKYEWHPQADFESHVFWYWLWLNDDSDSIGSYVPYLHAPEPYTRLTGAANAAGRQFTAGLVWRGQPKYEGNNRLQRSARLSSFAPLAKLSHARFYSLQTGPACEEDLRDGAVPFPITDLGSRFNSFTDTATAMRSLDVIVTVDTSTAHLAGAMGRPTFVLLPYAACWRWLRDTTSSPWYPTMRLFRQSSPDDWTEVLERVQSALRDFAATNASCPADAELTASVP